MLVISGEALRHNAQHLLNELSKRSIQLNAVTKCFLSDERIIEAYFEAGVRIFSDSRVATGKKISSWARKKKNQGVKACLLRPPAKTETEEAVRCFDRFYISTIEAGKFLASEARAQRKLIELVLMVETGFMREGFMKDELLKAHGELSKEPNIKMIGLGLVGSCSDGLAPLEKEIDELKNHASMVWGTDEVFISGGNSSALFLLKKGVLPRFNGELRIGEALLFGHETVTYKHLSGLRSDAFKLYAEVVEERKKSCDKMQVVVALGKADIGEASVWPAVDGLIEKKRSSDYIVLEHDGKDSGMLKPGNAIAFTPSYFALLSAFLSPIVGKVFV